MYPVGGEVIVHLSGHLSDSLLAHDLTPLICSLLPTSTLALVLVPTKRPVRALSADLPPVSSELLYCALAQVGT